jgi:hypothetical protein
MLLSVISCDLGSRSDCLDDGFRFYSWPHMCAHQTIWGSLFRQNFEFLWPYSNYVKIFQGIFLVFLQEFEYAIGTWPIFSTINYFPGRGALVWIIKQLKVPMSPRYLLIVHADIVVICSSKIIVTIESFSSMNYYYMGDSINDIVFKRHTKYYHWRVNNFPHNIL